MAWQGQTVEAGTIVQVPDLAPHRDLQDLAQAYHNTRQGPGVDVGHMVLWQLTQRWWVPIWLGWSMFWSNP